MEVGTHIDGCDFGAHPPPEPRLTSPSWASLPDWAIDPLLLEADDEEEDEEAMPNKAFPSWWARRFRSVLKKQ
jgi:hypothetical protein